MVTGPDARSVICERLVDPDHDAHRADVNVNKHLGRTVVVCSSTDDARGPIQWHSRMHSAPESAELSATFVVMIDVS